MRRLVFAVLALAALAVPSVALAGNGTTTTNAPATTTTTASRGTTTTTGGGSGTTTTTTPGDADPAAALRGTVNLTG